MDHTKSEGFKKAKATLSPAFSSAVTEYVVDVPAGTTHVNVMATSFSGASVKIADVPGNMCCVDIRGGVSAVPITLELNGATRTRRAPWPHAFRLGLLWQERVGFERLTRN